MTINLPFSRLGIAMGEPIHVPTDAGPAVLEAYRQKVEAALNEVTAGRIALPARYDAGNAAAEAGAFVAIGLGDEVLVRPLNQSRPRLVKGERLALMPIRRRRAGHEIPHFLTSVLVAVSMFAVTVVMHEAARADGGQAISRQVNLEPNR
jgi:hypothetical protein